MLWDYLLSKLFLSLCNFLAPLDLVCLSFDILREGQLRPSEGLNGLYFFLLDFLCIYFLLDRRGVLVLKPPVVLGLLFMQDFFVFDVV